MRHSFHLSILSPPLPHSFMSALLSFHLLSPRASLTGRIGEDPRGRQISLEKESRRTPRAAVTFTRYSQSPPPVFCHQCSDAFRIAIFCSPFRFISFLLPGTHVKREDASNFPMIPRTAAWSLKATTAMPVYNSNPMRATLVYLPKMDG